MTAPAGYIHDQRCVSNPAHGNAYALEGGMFCPHSEHTSPKGLTQSFWTWTQWEDAKTDEPKPSIDPQARPRRAIAAPRKTRKTSAKANRRRAR